MKIGCFALIEPFSDMARQFQAIAEMGIQYADLTDSHDGASLGSEFGFAATISLDGHPQAIRHMIGDTGIQLTAVCAHANLLDPPSPEAYGTPQIIKAIQLAHFMGIKQVVTTEGDPKTAFGESLAPEQRIFAIREKLHHPIAWAKELGIELLLEPHGIVTDDIDALDELLNQLGEPETVGLNLDTGNLWLGGGDPLAFIERFGPRIKHVHWKDMPEEWVEKRGTMYGCGMAVIPLGDGVIAVKEAAEELVRIGFDGPTTLEIAGADAVKTSAERLMEWTS
ncbi:sugar phosphate isomerase/epimerase family protein [Algisphaera agarilytica]|uniref:Inosose dehydratase n=1 Tax=Algisphaera agarilytica TaxID=1385975 RepID=A0A7X0H346_9BACT|nr:sugar phosphate isomerase/epimerase family protein [Algisphaera agarilytica]MBB6428197.1 inosose dehydratase [Algisphaera agarilytica]